MDRDRFERLRSKHGGYGSWAIWDSALRADTQIIEDSVDELHASVVMVGLNVSAPTPVAWSNFHIGRNDRKLEYAFSEAPYRGAYMTDLLKEIVEPSSAAVIRRVNRDPALLRKNIDWFIEEMEEVGATEDSLFLLFGGYVSDLFAKHVAPTFPNFVPCQHFAVYGSSESWSEQTHSQIATSVTLRM